MRTDKAKLVDGRNTALQDALTQYVLSIPAGHLEQVKDLSKGEDRSVQSLLREGIEMLLAARLKEKTRRLKRDKGED